MILSEFKSLFKKELEPLYPPTEIHSFYRMVLEHYLKLSRLEAALDPNLELTTSSQKELQTCITELKSFKPIQYILGYTEFCGLPFKVNPSVLIPRPETVELVQWVIASSHKNDSILDIGTGSGCIAVSIAKNTQNKTIHAIDVSKTALETAKLNAKLNEV